MGAPAHDGGKTRAGHLGDAPDGVGDQGVSRSRVSVVDGGEAGGDAWLTGGDGDVPGFESRHGAGRCFDVLGAVPGCHGGDRQDGAIGRHGHSPVHVGGRDSDAATGRGDRI